MAVKCQRWGLTFHCYYLYSRLRGFTAVRVFSTLNWNRASHPRYSIQMHKSSYGINRAFAFDSQKLINRYCNAASSYCWRNIFGWKKKKCSNMCRFSIHLKIKKWEFEKNIKAIPIIHGKSHRDQLNMPYDIIGARINFPRFCRWGYENRGWLLHINVKRLPSFYKLHTTAMMILLIWASSVSVQVSLGM